MKNNRLFLSIILVLLLVWTVVLASRLPIIDSYRDTPHIWLSCSTVNFTQHWLDRGALSTSFALTELPLSIESSELLTSDIYTSYPPGAVLPVWLLAKGLSLTPDISLVRIWNSCLQLLVALALARIVWNCLKSQNIKGAALGACTAGACYLLAWVPFSFHYSAYFADQAILLPVAALICYETSSKQKQWLPAIALLCFVGGLTDPLIYFIGGGIVLFRCWEGYRQKALWQSLLSTTYLTLPLALALLFYAWQIIHLGLLEAIINRFLSRSFGAPETGVSLNFLHAFKPLRRDVTPLIALIGGLCLLTRGNKGIQSLRQVKNKKLLVTLLFFLLLHTSVFLNHSIVHSFSMMKYSALFAIIAGCLVGTLYVVKFSYVRTICFAMGLLLLLPTSIMYIERIYKKREFHHIELARIVKKHHAYNKVFVSPIFEITTSRPELVSLSQKLVHRVESMEQIPPRLATLDPTTYEGIYLIPDDYLTDGELEQVQQVLGDSPIIHYTNKYMPSVSLLQIPSGMSVKDFIGAIQHIRSTHSD